jgi:hypothetical protein
MATKKLKSDKVKNLYHPDFVNKTEFAFEAGGIKYYCFKKDSDMRYGRYVVMQTFLQEYYLRVDLNTLQGDIKRLQGWLNPTIKDGKGQLELGKSLELLSIMEQRAQIAFEPDTVYRLSSCLYFDDQEILSDYDNEHNQKKIALWKASQTTDFFFHKLFQNVTGLMATSKEGLINYLTEVPEMLKGWRTMADILGR